MGIHGLKIRFSEKGLWKYRRCCISFAVELLPSSRYGVDRSILEPILILFSHYQPVLGRKPIDGDVIVKNVSGALRGDEACLMTLAGFLEKEHQEEPESAQLPCTWKMSSKFLNFGSCEDKGAAQFSVGYSVPPKYRDVVTTCSVIDLCRAVPLHITSCEVAIDIYSPSHALARIARLPTLQSRIEAYFTQTSVRLEFSFGDGIGKSEFILVREVFHLFERAVSATEEVQRTFEQVTTTLSKYGNIFPEPSQ